MQSFHRMWQAFTSCVFYAYLAAAMGQVILHIGYPKAGSTFLQQYFSAHPGVWYDGGAIGNYKLTGQLPADLITRKQGDGDFVISEEQLAVWQGNLDIVGVKFKPFDIKAHQLKTCKALYAQFPDAKVLIVTRGFASVMASMYSQYVSIGGIDTPAEFVTEFTAIMVDFYDYNYLLTIYRETFGVGNVVVLPFELLKQNPEKFLMLVEQQTALPHFTMDTSQVNSSLDGSEAESYRRLSKGIYKVVQILPYGIRRIVYGLYVYLLYSRKLHWLLRRFKSAPVQLVADEAVLSRFRGKATLLAEENLYAPYRKEYLI